MVRIECDAEGGFSIVEGYETFLELMERKGTVEVREATTDQKYFAHEVGKEIYLLNEESQHTLAHIATLLIQDISGKAWPSSPSR